jgi:ABC-type uncharacterized transport system permease subunit
MESLSLVELFLSALRFAAPLILAAIAGLYSERSGVIQIALEGFMLFGAFVGATSAHMFGHGLTGLFMASAFGVMVGVFYGILVLKLKADQIVAGTAINMLAWGGIPVVSKMLFDVTSNTPALEASERLPHWMPIVVAVTIVAVSYVLIHRTPFGLWLTVAGEKPEALRAAGVSPAGVRWIALMISGGVAALGGALLSISLASSYTRNMTAGRGFMALAALILGKWKPVPACIACLLFGVCEVAQLKLQGIMIPGFGVVPVQLVQILPYAITMFLLAGVVGESRAPAKLGQS